MMLLKKRGLLKGYKGLKNQRFDHIVVYSGEYAKQGEMDKFLQMVN
jgi:hypothetical protein